MGSAARILAVVDADVDGAAARAMLKNMCQSGELVIADAPDALDGLVQSEPWAAILHCGSHDSDTVDQIDRLRPDLAIVTLNVNSDRQRVRFDLDIEPPKELSPRTVVWSAMAVAVGVLIGSWFLVNNLMAPIQYGPDDLIAIEQVEELMNFSTASGSSEED